VVLHVPDIRTAGAVDVEEPTGFEEWQKCINRFFEEGLYTYRVVVQAPHPSPSPQHFIVLWSPELRHDVARERPSTQPALPLAMDEKESLRSELLEAKRTVRGLAEENGNLKEELKNLRQRENEMLSALSRYRTVLRGARIAGELERKGHLLFSEAFRGRVENVSEDSIDVVFEDPQGEVFSESYRREAFRGVRNLAVGEAVYVFAALYREPLRSISLRALLDTDSGIEDLRLPSPPEP